MDKFMEIAGKIGSQKHMIAIRDGFASTMPLVMAGAIAVMINNVLFVPWSLLASFIGGDNPFIVFTNQWIAPFFGAIDAGTLSLTALGIAMALAYIRAQQEEVDSLAAVLIAAGSFFILRPNTRVSDVAGHITHYFGAMGILVGMLVGLIVTEIFIAIVKKGWTIKMPDMVPPAVGRGFAAIIPGAFALGATALVPYLFSILPSIVPGYAGAANIFEFSEKSIQGVLMGWFGGLEGNSSFLPGLIGAAVLKLIMQVFWVMGLHGANLAQPALQPIWGTFDNLNMLAYQADGAKAILYPWTSGSFAAYVDLGGSGSTLGLLIAYTLFNKRPDVKEVAAVAWGPAVFEINEPIIFGVPIVLNPIYMIPFIFTPVVLTIFAYMMTQIGFAGRMVNTIAWTTPPVLGAAMASNFNIGAIITSLACVAIATLMYTPFVFMANKQFAKQMEEK